jgi:hypothetical protein
MFVIILNSLLSLHIRYKIRYQSQLATGDMKIILLFLLVLQHFILCKMYLILIPTSRYIL